jgi:hypothetical protein
MNCQNLKKNKNSTSFNPIVNSKMLFDIEFLAGQAHKKKFMPKLIGQVDKKRTIAETPSKLV